MGVAECGQGFRVEEDYQRGYVRYLYDLYDALESISTSIRKLVATTPSDYMVATPQARHLDNEKFAGKRKREFDPAAWLKCVSWFELR